MDKVNFYWDKLETMASQTLAKLEKLRVDKPRLSWAIAIAIFFFAILALNILTPMMADDLAYRFFFGAGYPKPIENLNDLIYSQINHYNMWGGRSVVHFIGQGLLQFPYYIADLLNSLVYVLFTFLIYQHIIGTKKTHSLSLYILINLFSWFLLPAFGDTILWLTGSANYLWGTTIILLFLLPYRLIDKNREQSPLIKFLAIPTMLVAGVIAGWTNENTVVGLIVIAILFIVLRKVTTQRLDFSLISGVIGLLIGFYLMISAPGNFIRTGADMELSLVIVLRRIFTSTHALFVDYGLLIILITTLFYFVKEREARLSSLIYIIGGTMAIYAMLASPQFPPRAWFGIVTFLLIAIGILYTNLEQTKSLKKARNIIIIIGFLSFAFSFAEGLKETYRAQSVAKEREELAKQAIEHGDEYCYFTQFVSDSRFVHNEEKETSFLLSYHYGIYIKYNEE